MITLCLFRRGALGAVCAGALSLGFAVIPGMATPSPAAAQSATDDLDRAITALRGISTMRANFTETRRDGTVRRGTITIKQGGKLRLEFWDRPELLTVSDGRTLHDAYSDANQPERIPITASALSAILFPERDVKRLGTLMPSGNRNVLAVMVEDPQVPKFGSISMIFVRRGVAPGGWQLTSFVVTTPPNNRSTFRLGGHSYGAPIEDAKFVLPNR